MGRHTEVPRWRVTVPPACEPLPLDDIKTHARVIGTQDDGYIAGLVRAARQYCERLQGRAYLTQTRTLTLDRFPLCHRSITLPGAPLQEVTSVIYTPNVGSPVTLAPSTYIVDTSTEPGRIVLVTGQDWPSDELVAAGGLVITYVAGIAPVIGAATISQATPAVVGWVGHGLPQGARVSFSTTNALPAPLVAEHSYYVVAVDADHFQLSNAPGGSSIATTNAGAGTHAGTSVWQLSESIIHAIKFLAAYWYEQREAVADQTAGTLKEAPRGIEDLISIDRLWGFV